MLRALGVEEDEVKLGRQRFKCANENLAMTNVPRWTAAICGSRFSVSSQHIGPRSPGRWIQWADCDIIVAPKELKDQNKAWSRRRGSGGGLK